MISLFHSYADKATTNSPELYIVNTQQSALKVNDLIKLLTKQEIARADLYQNNTSKVNFIFGHAITKILLSEKYHHLNLRPQQIIFSLTGYGKPYYQPAVEISAPWAFNISHSGNWLAIAFAKTAIGIDIETLNRHPNLSELCNLFHPLEQQQLNLYLNNPKINHNAIILALWTAKEALIKATGQGMQLDFKQFYLAVDKLLTTSEQIVTIRENKFKLKLHRDAEKIYTVAVKF